ncbi:MAG: 5-formyltetrahydrofolate cyclo-ligase [Woeseiaceae bacterium]
MNQLRAAALRARREMDEHERVTASELICQRVIHSGLFFASRSIACYLPMADEVDTRGIIEAAWRANKRIFVPVLRERGKMLFRELSHKTALEQNSFGVWEPVDGELISPRNLDITITPTVAFDRNNNRIGMGGGYFDRCFAYLRLRQLWFRPKLIGVAFACQAVEEIRPNPWDIRLYKVFSDAD